MAHISGKETKPEIWLRSELFKLGFRFRKNVKILPGKPDIVLAKYKTSIFFHGCFWHGHHCKAAALPTSNIEFWKTKINSNIVRDAKNIAELKTIGYNVIVIWQCEIKNKQSKIQTLDRVVSNITRIRD